jgi:hypothetical protein
MIGIRYSERSELWSHAQQAGREQSTGMRFPGDGAVKNS